MQVKQLTRIKEQTESRLTNAIAGILLEFEQDTGFQPTDIEIRFMRVEALHGKITHILQPVKLEVRL